MIRRVFGNLYFLTFLNGFLLASLFYFKMEANYEKELFQAIHTDINTKIKRSDSQDSVVVKAMHACHNLMDNRGSVFEGKPFGGLKSESAGTYFFRSDDGQGCLRKFFHGARPGTAGL